MRSPRWRKVLADLWSNKTRTVLVVLSIAVGVFAVGMIDGSGQIVTRDLRVQYAATRPSVAQIYTRDAFDDDLVQAIRRMRDVGEAEGRRTVQARYNIGPQQWKEIWFIALRDYKDIRVDKVFPKSGAWPPPEKELLLEQSSLAMVGARVGDVLLIETPDGTRRRMRIAGVVHDLSQISSFFRGLAYAYISMDSLEWLGETRDFNQLNFSMDEVPLTKARVETVAGRVRNKIENSGRAVFFTLIFDKPGRHWADDSLQTMTLILGVLGVLSLLLSGLLVVNTVTALVTQQMREIGIMKAVGGRGNQIIGMYLATIVAFGGLALLLAVPLGVIGAQALSAFTGRLMNFDILGYSLASRTLALQVATGLLVPVLAALYPVLSGVRITVRQAISSYGLAEEPRRRGWLDRLIEGVRGFSRPTLLSLRNTFRRKGRVMLTLTTLTLAGAIFIGILSVQNSLMGLMETLFNYWNYDVQIEFSRSYRLERLEREALAIPGVTAAESWAFRSTRRIRADDTESPSIFLIALPAATKMLNPILLQGRWLLPADENALVINTDLTKEERDVRVGDEIVLKIGTRKSRWTVVGLVQGILSGPIAYANYPYAAQQIRTFGRADRVQVVTQAHDAPFVTEVSRALEARFRQLGLRMTANQTVPEIRKQVAAQFNVIIVFLLVMAVLLAVVGGLGLMGTMSINVLERTREIGVMRAIGASDRAVIQIVMVEGIVIGLISWALGAVLALPLGYGLSNAVGLAFLRIAPAFKFSVIGVGLWLAIVVVLAAVASFLPAWNASRLTVRDVLAYE
ncbi:MAG: FtsX-like permease family protein [Armatimonadota bacterium]|nr:FtsX-like permease family protein [Armatimonadota bacterium]